MKKILGILLLLTPFLTGCATIDTVLSINDDNSASIVSSVTYKGDLSNSKEPEMAFADKIYPKFLDNLYSVKPMFSRNLSTVTATKSVKNLKRGDLDLSSLGFESMLGSGRFIEIRKNFIISSYNVDLIYNMPKQAKLYKQFQKKMSQQSSISSSLTPEYYHKYAASSELQEKSIERDVEYDLISNLDDSVKMLLERETKSEVDNNQQLKPEEFNATFSIKVPGFASYNNADTVKGNIYIWNIKENEPTEIKFQYVRYSGLAIAIVILSGVLLLMYIAKRIIRRDTTKRLDNIENIV